MRVVEKSVEKSLFMFHRDCKKIFNESGLTFDIEVFGRVRKHKNNALSLFRTQNPFPPGGVVFFGQLF